MLLVAVEFSAAVTRTEIKCLCVFLTSSDMTQTNDRIHRDKLLGYVRRVRIGGGKYQEKSKMDRFGELSPCKVQSDKHSVYFQDVVTYEEAEAGWEEEGERRGG